MKKWEIWKAPTLTLRGRATAAMYKACTKLHHRYTTRKEADRVAGTMRAQGTVVCVRKRKEA